MDKELCAPTEDVGKGQKREHVLNWLECRLDVDLHGRCEEVFCVRDVIVHAHTWHARKNPHRTLLFAEQPRLHRYGHLGFRRVIDQRTRRSRVLRLNAFPTRSWRRDAYLAYQTMIDAMTAFEPLDPTRMDFSNRGRVMLSMGLCASIRFSYVAS